MYISKNAKQRLLEEEGSRSVILFQKNLIWDNDEKENSIMPLSLLMEELQQNLTGNYWPPMRALMRESFQVGELHDQNANQCYQQNPAKKMDDKDRKAEKSQENHM